MATVIQAIHSAFTAKQNCDKNVANFGADPEWAERWQERLDQLQDRLPSGSGFDCGTRIVGKVEQAVILQTDYHHMDEHGCYSHWTRHDITVFPTFDDCGFDFKVECNNAPDDWDIDSFDDYLCDTLHAALSAEAPKAPWA